VQSSEIDPAALGFTVVSLSIALEEALKALAEQNGNQAGPWLDEVGELALLRAKGRLTEAQDKDAAAAAIAVVEAIFARMRAGYTCAKA
jgi:Cu/Ag efflux pump CusA